MSQQSLKPADLLRRRCRTMAGLFFCLLLLITLGLWRASIDYMDIRFLKVSNQNTRLSTERFTTLFEDRLTVLRHAGHFFENMPDLQEKQFQAYCNAILADTPGIRAIMLTDTKGHPTWIAPRDVLPMPVIYIMTANSKLENILSQALSTRQTLLSEWMDVPDLGAGFLAVSPIISGNQHLGFVIGVFQYQELFTYILPPDLLTRYRVNIAHAGHPIFPAPTGTRPLAGSGEDSGTRYLYLGGQEWTVSMTPLASPAASPVNLVSLTILILGLVLSGLLTYLAYRWQWKAALFQAQARDSLKRLERTGLWLAEIKTEMDLILNSVDEGIIFYDEHLEPIQANAAFLSVFGLGEDDLAMRAGHAHHEHMIRLIGSETKYWSLFNSLKNKPDQTYTDELEVRPRGGQGSYKALLRRAASAVRPDGSASGVLVLYKDMTRIKMIDRVKDEFLANVTHELRSPLASIKGFAETIHRNPAMPDDTRSEFVRIICDEAARLQNLIDELLDLRRMEAKGVVFTPVPYDIKALVEETVKNTRSVLLSKKLTATIRWDGLFGSNLKGDLAQLSRALRNLLINAVKYSPDEGEITITGHLGRYRVWIEVADQGAGIDEKDLPHIFDKFYRGTTQGYQKGTGLGLAIVKNIVEMHGGHLGVRSEVGVGTTFRIDLPRVCPPANGSVPAGRKTTEIPAETPLEILHELEEEVTS